MKAWRFYGRRDFRLEDVSWPHLNEDEVLLKVTSCGICQTDVDEFMAGPKIFNNLPFIPGHEFGGEIVEVGKKISKDKIGKFVTVSPLIYCGECFFCKRGKENLCDNVGYYGAIGYNGGFSEYAVVKERNIIEVETPEVVHFGEILLVALRVFNLAKEHAFQEEKVLVIGAGPVGLCVALTFQYYGYQVELCEIREFRRDFAANLGFKTYSFIEEIPKETYPLVIDCAGEDPIMPYTFASQMEKLKKAGVIVVVGLYFSELPLKGIPFLLGERRIISSFLYTPRELKELSLLMNAMKVPLKKMTKRVSFDKLIDTLLELEINKEFFLKVVLSHEDN